MSSDRNQSSLSADKLIMLTQSLNQVSREERAKIVLLLISNAIEDYKMAKESMKSFGCMMVLFAGFPPFWPFLYFMRKSAKAGLIAEKRKIINAIEIFREDLGAAHEALLGIMKDLD